MLSQACGEGRQLYNRRCIMILGQDDHYSKPYITDPLLNLPTQQSSQGFRHIKDNPPQLNLVQVFN